jgi:hypothetical protein
MKTVTLSEILDAMEKNGYTKYQGEFVIYEDVVDTEPQIKAACAVGQAALNLGVHPSSLYKALNWWIDDETYYLWGDDIARDNDTTEMTVPEIAHKYRKELKKFLNKEFMVY